MSLRVSVCVFTENGNWEVSEWLLLHVDRGVYSGKEKRKRRERERIVKQEALRQELKAERIAEESTKERRGGRGKQGGLSPIGLSLAVRRGCPSPFFSFLQSLFLSLSLSLSYELLCPPLFAYCGGFWHLFLFTSFSIKMGGEVGVRGFFVSPSPCKWFPF